jgi:hypothetical protein
MDSPLPLSLRRITRPRYSRAHPVISLVGIVMGDDIANGRTWT